MPAKSLGQEMIEALREFHEVIKAGTPLEEKYLVTERKIVTARSLKLPASDPLTPGQILEARKALGVSQAVFADFLGVSAGALRSWEQGNQKPSRIASRFIDEIRQDPGYWLKRLRKAAAAVARRGKRAEVAPEEAPRPAAKARTRIAK